jgi:hypothetical protein
LLFLPYGVLPVDKKALLRVIQNPSASSADEAQAIIALQQDYPFSQVIHALSAKLSKDLSLPNQQHHLQNAAVHITDRTVLKEIMILQVGDTKSDLIKNTTANADQVIITERSPVQSSSVENKLDVTTDASQTERIVVYKDIEKTIDQMDMADEIIRDLKKLNESKHNFEMLFTDQLTISVPVSQPPVLPKPAIEEEPNSKESADHHKTRREKIIALARSMAGSTGESPDTHPARKKRKDGQSDLIEEIKITKEEIQPESERQKQQIQIIDHFIKTQPTINNTVKERNPMPPADFNQTKSGEFSENIVSETLVEILIKQGKKDRAIEVLKKLIWKYPQKKVYFASRIEDLKK